MGQTPKSRSQGQNKGTHGKVLSQVILIWNIKALALIVQKLLVRLCYQKMGQSPRSRSQGKT